MTRDVRLSITPTWAKRFLELAQVVATWSKDPSTKVGAVIVDVNRRIVATGYNGLPQGVDDAVERYTNRDVKYPMIVHAETNAILHAGRRLDDCCLVVMMHPCARCAGLIIQSGLRFVAFPHPSYDDRMQREPWKTEGAIALQMMQEADVEILYLHNDEWEAVP